jgi:Cd2+/Zn2+-exporting ATPase
MSTDTAQHVNWTVTGMDCASCALKIRSALEPLPGVGEVAVSVMSETLALRLMPGTTPVEEIERRVKRLGYGIVPLAADAGAARAKDAHGPAHDHAHDHDHDHGHAHGPAGGGWLSGPKGRLVAWTGLLLALAWIARLAGIEPAAGWAFAVACVVALVPVARRAFAALSMGQPFTIEMLMTVAAAGALAIGAAEEAALVVFLFAVGEVLEGFAADRARANIKALADLIPRTATVETDGGTKDVDAGALTPGQIVRVRPGERIPADGEIAGEATAVDESPVTGESVPRHKEAGDPVYAGSIVQDAATRVRVTRAAADNTIARIVRLVEEAQDARAPSERFVDRFSRIYMPFVVTLAILVAVVPPVLAGADWGTWIYRALALLLVGCPCALVISVPASISSALAAGARRGLLLKGGAVVEAAARARTIAFDKTGTLTKGTPVVTDVAAFGAAEAEVLALAASVSGDSSHPLSRAIVAAALARAVAVPQASGAAALAGRGARAVVDGTEIVVAAPRFAAELGLLDAAATARIEDFQRAGKTVSVVLRGERAVGAVALRDELRADAKAALAELHALGVSTTMLTGDNAATAAALAADLGIAVRAGLLPADKVAVVREMAQAAPVMMVGDGINDAPALAAASVGIAMGSATGVALETADGALLRDRVADVPRLVRLARAAMANVRENVTLALALKAVFLLTSVAGYTGLWVAILADTGATVLVTLNALRLLRFESAPAAR